jgi:hypothetical protein
MFKKFFAVVLFATAIFAAPLTYKSIDPIPNCYPCEVAVAIDPIPNCYPCEVAVVIDPIPNCYPCDVNTAS